MFSLTARLATLRLAVPLVRGVATNGGHGTFNRESRSAQYGQNSTSNERKEGSSSRSLGAESLTEQVDSMAQSIAKTPHMTLDSRNYQKRARINTVYHPGELNEEKQTNYPKKLDDQPTKKDPFLALGTNPLRHYKNASMLAHFITDMGKIKPRKTTSLTAKSQRRIAKAIKRARAFGLLPLMNKPALRSDYGRRYFSGSS
ncbi:hypothetical protein GGI11_006716 [Coemansia sp. RSA 2049]|nr:hypothetical protein GGI11_006716 [Coemansia sp. RSA 2049]KAJ2519750.1 hypothetical protein H4217_002491 [Coemansia sp. RSA 1939]KAJ2614049.1 hypothetical protein EV177_002250 [Coemansia sp. RSA 1804]KAJ2682504.1 hypothetical protein GGH99_004716 [Coemansia sp. RSA 1285]